MKTHQFDRLLCSHSNQDVDLYLMTLKDNHTIKREAEKTVSKFYTSHDPFYITYKHTEKKTKNILTQCKQV